MSTAGASVSPCVGICKLNASSGYYLGCARSGDEIAAWSWLSAADRQSVWDALPERFAELGVACRKLPWDSEAMRKFVVDTTTGPSGTWVL